MDINLAIEHATVCHTGLLVDDQHHRRGRTKNLQSCAWKEAPLCRIRRVSVIQQLITLALAHLRRVQAVFPTTAAVAKMQRRRPVYNDFQIAYVEKSFGATY